jgi:hypothetical protein
MLDLPTMVCNNICIKYYIIVYYKMQIFKTFTGLILTGISASMLPGVIMVASIAYNSNSSDENKFKSTAFIGLTAILGGAGLYNTYYGITDDGMNI